MRRCLGSRYRELLGPLFGNIEKSLKNSRNSCRVLRADFDWGKPDRRREFLRVRLNAEGGLELFANQSSGVLTSAVWADGLLDNPPGQAIARGDIVRFLPLSEMIAR